MFKIRSTEQKSNNWKNVKQNLTRFKLMPFVGIFTIISVGKNSQHWENFWTRWKILIYSMASLLVILKGISFTHKNMGGRKLLLKREHMTAWRSRFLGQIRKKRFDEILWIEETWINAWINLNTIWRRQSYWSIFLYKNHFFHCT